MHVRLQGVLSGDIHLANGRVHHLHAGVCNLWVGHWPHNVHQKQLGCTGPLPDELFSMSPLLLLLMPYNTNMLETLKAKAHMAPYGAGRFPRYLRYLHKGGLQCSMLPVTQHA